MVSRHGNDEMGFDELDRLLEDEIAADEASSESDRPSILVIDDDNDVRDALGLILSDSYKVTLCDSGDEGIAKVNKDTHAVLLDIKMRGKDGFETFEAIKNKCPDVPIIFHSAYQGIKDPYEIMNNYRPFGYILKGSNSSELLDTLASATEFYRRKLLNEKLIEELQETNTRLDKSNRKLGEALTQAKMSARVKSEFIANMSHELKTPLNAIINIPDHLISELTSDEPVPLDQNSEEVVSLLHSVVKAGRRLSQIFDDILDIGTLESGKISVQREEFCVANLISDVAQNLQIVAEKKNISIITPSAETLKEMTLVADRIKLGQILVHLVANGIKFSDAGAQVEVSADEQPDKIVFSVRDWGIGIDEEHQSIIFDSFRQVNNTSTRPYGGAGLGLSITKRLVELHGGRIWVVSEPGKGSCFSFSIPLQSQKVSETRPSNPASHFAPIRGRTIFMLDDDSNTLELAKNALFPVGYRIEISDNPEVALQEISQIHPHLVILDIMMPKKDGLTILRQLKEDETLRDTAVLVSSGFYSNREVVVEMGAHWIAKPWTTDELVNAVAEIMADIPV